MTEYPALQRPTPGSFWLLAPFTLLPVVFGGELENPVALGRAAAAGIVFTMAGYGLNRYEKLSETEPDAPGRTGAVILVVVLVNIAVAMGIFLSRPLFVLLLLYGVSRVGWLYARREHSGWLGRLEQQKASAIGLGYLSWATVLMLLGGGTIRFLAGAVAAGVSPVHWIALSMAVIASAFVVVRETDTAVDSITKAPARAATLDEE